MVKFIVKSLHNISEFLLWRSIDISEWSMKINEYFKEDEEDVDEEQSAIPKTHRIPHSKDTNYPCKATDVN